ncbi:hypothetical protein LSUE1_G008499 [Lachnellula suecica]|uniref:Luciferase domain-containing protein n=1 Tax=Lachnellula suecica TaxID=602035 RepID=A0A8T9BXN6_9HELO|nr:hypothetical protein LSUE1_G008499 [Lachnellula suecica]
MEAPQSTMTTQVMFREAEPELIPDTMACITQQSVVQITLSGPSLVFAIVAIIISIQILQPSLTCTLLALAPIPWIIHNDYLNFISLGPGGTPSTFLGYLKVTYLRLFALSDPYSPASFNEEIYPDTGYYQKSQTWLPKRFGPRPKIAGIAPQRQLDQPGCEKSYKLLRKTLENLAARHPEALRIGTSCFEKKGLALFARDPINATCRGEVCHVHHSDRSLHMNLHPDDAKVVLEMGWGERHPLARGGWMKAYVPREFVMVYAPRNRLELDGVCRIIEAAGFWVSGKQFKVEVDEELPAETHAQ